MRAGTLAQLVRETRHAAAKDAAFSALKAVVAEVVAWDCEDCHTTAWSGRKVFCARCKRFRKALRLAKAVKP